jgi:hypothetical protein
MEAEYSTMSRAAKPLVHYRDFLRDLGFPQTTPSKLLADNQSAIKLVQAPLVPSKSRHIRLPMHHIRDLFNTREITPAHERGNDLVPGVMTKDTGPSRFLYFRDNFYTSETNFSAPNDKKYKLQHPPDRNQSVDHFLNPLPLILSLFSYAS